MLQIKWHSHASVDLFISHYAILHIGTVAISKYLTKQSAKQAFNNGIKPRYWSILIVILRKLLCELCCQKRTERLFRWTEQPRVSVQASMAFRTSQLIWIRKLVTDLLRNKQNLDAYSNLHYVKFCWCFFSDEIQRRQRSRRSTYEERKSS